MYNNNAIYIVICISMSVLSQQERLYVFELLVQWTSKYEIAKRLGRHHTTIGRELQRNGKGKYDPIKAQHMYTDRRTRTNQQRCILLHNTKLREILELRLQNKEEDRSPDAIVGRIRQEWWVSVCSKTVYNYINNYAPSWKKYLKYKWWYRKKKKWRIGRLYDSIDNIELRPENVTQREVLWHWEWDTVVSKNRSCVLVTYVERKTRYLLMQKCLNSKANTIHENTLKLLDSHKDSIQTITIDNGKEFADAELTGIYLWVTYYRANPYCSWERWTNEHTNGMIRKHLPKKFDFKALQDHEILAIQEKINKKPRRLLWYMTPYELFHNKKLAYFSQMCVSK
jgi:IS30 family transposase